MDKYKAVKDANRMYRDRVEWQMEKGLWQGLQTITDYWGRTPSTVSADASLADDLNSFFARLEASKNAASGTVAEGGSIARDEHTLSVTEHNMRRALM